MHSQYQSASILFKCQSQCCITPWANQFAFCFIKSLNGGRPCTYLCAISIVMMSISCDSSWLRLSCHKLLLEMDEILETDGPFSSAVLGPVQSSPHGQWGHLPKGNISRHVTAWNCANKGNNCEVFKLQNVGWSILSLANDTI